MTDNLTLCVTAFERPKALTALLASIRDRYPTIRVLVGDNSRRPPARRDVEMIPFRFDSGVAQVRNELLVHVTTPYVIFLEDDFLFMDDTRLEVLTAHLDRHPDLDVVAGMVLSRTGLESHYEGLLEIEQSTLHYRPGNRGFVGDLPLYDVVFNFFAARPPRIREIGWDPQLKLAEHSDFFLRAKGKLKVAYDPTVRIGHAQATSTMYSKYRSRGVKFAGVFLRKHGLQMAVGFRGEVIKASG